MEFAAKLPMRPVNRKVRYAGAAGVNRVLRAKTARTSEKAMLA
jgi:hypothetical protein